MQRAHMEATIPQLVREIASDTEEVVRSEIRLAKVEISEQFSIVKRISNAGLPGIVLSFYAVGFLLLTCVYALEMILPAWLAALIVAVGVGIGAASLLAAAYRSAKHVHATPERTLNSLKENVRWAKSQLK